MVQGMYNATLDCDKISAWTQEDTEMTGRGLFKRMFVLLLGITSSFLLGLWLYTGFLFTGHFVCVCVSDLFSLRSWRRKLHI